MRYESLFQEAARHDEPPLRPDVLTDVRRAQARRRRAQVLTAAPLAVVAVVATVLLLPGQGSHPQPPTNTATGPPAPPLPAAFSGIRDGHLVHVRTSTLDTGDRGPATAYAGGWTATQTSPCHSRVRNNIANAPVTFDVEGAVGAMAVSPDGRTLAYARSGQATRDLPEYPCEMDSLVLRDVASGNERVWSGDDGSLSSMSWSPDSTHLAFQAVSCCDRSTEIKTLDVSRPTGPVSAIENVDLSGDEDLFHDPVWSGDTLLLLRDVVGTSEPDRHEVVELAGLRVVATLPDEGESLDERDGWLLVSLYGSPTRPGRLIALHAKGTLRELGTGYSQPRWG